MLRGIAVVVSFAVLLVLGAATTSESETLKTISAQGPSTTTTVPTDRGAPGSSLESSEMTRIATEWTAQKHQWAVNTFNTELARQAETVRAKAAAAVQAAARPVSEGTVGPTNGCAYEGLIRSIWTEDADWAVSVAMRESRCQPGASNPSGAHGLFQMLGHHDIFVRVGCEDEFNPECNAKAAFSLYQGLKAQGKDPRAPWNL